MDDGIGMKKVFNSVICIGDCHACVGGKSNYVEHDYYSRYKHDDGCSVDSCLPRNSL